MRRRRRISVCVEASTRLGESALAGFGGGVGGVNPASQTGALGVEFGKTLRARM